MGCFAYNLIAHLLSFIRFMYVINILRLRMRKGNKIMKGVMAEENVSLIALLISFANNIKSVKLSYVNCMKNDFTR